MKIHTVANADYYEINGLPPGSYKLTITAVHNTAGPCVTPAEVQVEIPVPAPTEPPATPVVE